MDPVQRSPSGIAGSGDADPELGRGDGVVPTVENKSTVDSTPVPAIVVRDGAKSYNKGSPVLKHFDMTVPAGTIYALLGSSGCGKTTILSCCVGLKVLDSGSAKIFGYPPGSKESGVPGRRVGYMPQEISMYLDLSIEESLSFYGRVYGMNGQQIKEATNFLMNFLDLPKHNRRIKTLSGGQQRRASVAITLVHDPELLILDEPTVGVDPLLRESIWNHLVKLVAKGRTTVIVTTHYIDEAKQAHTIGIMRNGRLLTESSPKALMKQYNTPNLEEVLLILCRKDHQAREEDAKRRASEIKHDEKSELTFKTLVDTTEPPPVTSKPESNESESGKQTQDTSLKEPTITVSNETDAITDRRTSQREELMKKKDNNMAMKIARMLALLRKDATLMLRSVGFLIFIFLVPSIQVLLCCLIIGADPRGLEVVIVNEDAEKCDSIKNYDSCPFPKGPTPSTQMTCYFINMLESIKSPTLPYHDDAMILKIVNGQGDVPKVITKFKKGVQMFEDGAVFGYIHFPKDYSAAFGCRFGIPDSSAPGCGVPALTGLNNSEIIARSTMNVKVDSSSFYIGNTIIKVIGEANQKLIRLMHHCDHAQLAKTADFIHLERGYEGKQYKGYLTPGLLLGLLFFFPLCSSSVAYISEKKNGTLDRMMVAGVTPGEFMGGFLFTQFNLLLWQSLLAFVLLSFFGVDTEGAFSKGNIVLAVLLADLVGISGMSAGFCLAMLCSNEVQAILTAIGTFFPNTLMSGMLVPLQTVEWKGFYWVSYLVPCTFACESLRAIMSRGWSLNRWRVSSGFLATSLWIIVYWVLAIIIHRFTHKK